MHRAKPYLISVGLPLLVVGATVAPVWCLMPKGPAVYRSEASIILDDRQAVRRATAYLSSPGLLRAVAKGSPELLVTGGEGAVHLSLVAASAEESERALRGAVDTYLKSPAVRPGDGEADGWGHTDGLTPNALVVGPTTASIPIPFIVRGGALLLALLVGVLLSAGLRRCIARQVEEREGKPRAASRRLSRFVHRRMLLESDVWGAPRRRGREEPSPIVVLVDD